jgi:hypothetical protein
MYGWKLVALAIIFATCYIAQINGLQHPFERLPESKPLCYSDPALRHDILRGKFVDRGYRTSRSWNFTCPLELSKQSCVHQGVNLTRAEHASYLHFEPSSCTLLGKEELYSYLGSSIKPHVLLIGNSILRQVMSAVFCDLHAMGLVEILEPQWQSCNGNGGYPCHGAAHCITCGPHSGYPEIHVKLKGGAKFRFIVGDSSERTVMPSLINHGPVDVVIAQNWMLELRAMKLIREHYMNNSMTLPKWIWMASWTSHFVDGGTLFYENNDIMGPASSNHGYNETLLQIMKEKLGVVPCEMGPKNDEFFRPEKFFDTWKPDGFVYLQETNSLGEFKVGPAVGKFGDCQHFCAPGPQDEIARAVVQLLLTLVK